MFISILKDIKSVVDPSRIDVFYEIICRYFKCQQIGDQWSIDVGIKRESTVLMVYDPSEKGAMVKHRDNRIWYQFNVTLQPSAAALKMIRCETVERDSSLNTH